MKEEAQSGLVKSWSNSTLDVYLECAYRLYLKKIKKVKVVLSEAEAEKQNKAKDRGSETHGVIEDYIFGRTDKLPVSKVKHRHDVINMYHQNYNGGNAKNVCVEEEWGFTPSWAESDWRADETWARIKIDAMLFESDTSARIDDWKTGKKYGNEGKHMRQLMTYACGAFMKYPHLKHIRGAMQYVDLASDNELKRNISRDSAMAYLPKLENQALKMTTCTDFKPCPNVHNCRFCEFANKIPDTNETYCEFAIKEL